MIWSTWHTVPIVVEILLLWLGDADLPLRHQKQIDGRLP